MTAQRRVSTVLSRAPQGLEAPLVRVEVHLCAGLPAFALVGLPEAVVRESKERVRSALTTAGFEFPAARITVNLSPADLPKEGGRFDLPIAVGILAAKQIIPPHELQRREFYGELSLGGELRETSKLLPALRQGAESGHELILPAANALEASFVSARKLTLARHFREVVDVLTGAPRHGAAADRAPAGGGVDDAARPSRPGEPPLDLADVRGQFGGKRALEVAAAGQHGLLFIGPPGAGKTMLAQRLPGLLPPLSAAEALEVASLQSASGARPCVGSIRPFRSPQHTASVASLIGGGSGMRPGELSLAHRGVLFLDELPEFPRNALEALREPLESGVVLLTRLKRSCRFPAQFQLLAAMNPCPCGYAGDARCRCTSEQVARYRNRISGPLVDRIDIHCELPAVPPEYLLPAGPDVRGGGCGAVCGNGSENSLRDGRDRLETSAAVAARVAAARHVQLSRQGTLNARLSIAGVAQYCATSPQSRSLLKSAMFNLGLSARAYHRVLKVARTCADLAGAADIRPTDIAEAVRLRALDRPTC